MDYKALSWSVRNKTSSTPTLETAQEFPCCIFHFTIVLASQGFSKVIIVFNNCLPSNAEGEFMFSLQFEFTRSCSLSCLFDRSFSCNHLCAARKYLLVSEWAEIFWEKILFTWKFSFWSHFSCISYLRVYLSRLFFIIIINVSSFLWTKASSKFITEFGLRLFLSPHLY